MPFICIKFINTLLVIKKGGGIDLQKPWQPFKIKEGAKFYRNFVGR